LKKTLIILGSVVVVLGVLVGVGFVLARNAISHAAEPPKVRVEPAGRGSLVELVSVPGEIQPLRKVSISPRVAARIAELPHKEGDIVEAVDRAATRPSRASLLVRLDAKDLQAALESARERAAAEGAQIIVETLRIAASEASLLATKAGLVDAERDMKRKFELAATKDISQSEADTAQSKYDEQLNTYEAARHTLASAKQNIEVLRHQQKASEAQIAKAEEDLSYTTISSPIAGVIIKVKAEEGEQVVPGIQGSVGSAILEVADLSQMLMVARVDEANVAAVKPGQRATVRIQAFRDETFEGVVESVALAKATSEGRSAGRAAESANYFEAKIRLKTDASRRIPTGLNADADIESRRAEGVKVPSQAVLGRPADGLPADLRAKLPDGAKEKSIVSVVYRWVDGKAVVTPVTVGPSDETHTLILSGLTEGDPVIVGPYKALDALAHDQVVTREDAPPRAAATKPATGPATVPATGPASAPATRSASDVAAAGNEK
jgi:HlyD family secretion protein